MGEVRTTIELRNRRDLWLAELGQLPAAQVRSVSVDALVDTGAVMILLPQDLVERLGLPRPKKAIVTLANEQKIELEVATDLSITVAGREWETDCLVGPPECEALLGQLVLERLDLIVDPLKQTVTPRPESPWLPSLKLK